MSLIFTKLNKSHAWLAVVCARLGMTVYYVDLLGKRQNEMSNWLLKRNVYPLPVEKLSHIEGSTLYVDEVYAADSDWWLSILPDGSIEKYSYLFKNIENLGSKLRAALKTSVLPGIVYKAIIYTRATPQLKYYLILTDVREIFLPVKEENIRVLFLPDFSLPLGSVYRGIKRIVEKIKRCVVGDNAEELLTCSEGAHGKVAYVVHQGLQYGELFHKNLFYSTEENSCFRSDNLLHISYSGSFPSPDYIQWHYVTGRNIGLVAKAKIIFRVFKDIVFSTRSVNQLLGVFFILGFYFQYASYRASLSNLKLIEAALIDYEMLCPKPLLLAFESFDIKTIAVQERYLAPFYQTCGAFVDSYLCASEASMEMVRKHPSFIVDECIVVGQYRADKLHENNASASRVIPVELKRAKQTNKKIIVGLGYHTHPFQYQSATDPLLSWSAQIAFIDDMLVLASTLENVFIVLRYKLVDWLNLPVFLEVIEKVNSAENIIISNEYSVDYYSYQLCSCADLVIAKQTSLADECLERGIPVLFYDYTHNSKNIISPIYTYEESDIVCRDYEQLLNMSRQILSGNSNKYIDEIKHIYSSSDGCVRERIHGWLKREFECLDT